MLKPKLSTEEAAAALPMIGEMEAAFRKTLTENAANIEERETVAEQFRLTILSMRKNLRSFVISKNPTYSKAAERDLDRASKLVAMVTQQTH